MLTSITPFQFMTDEQKAARRPGETDDLPYFKAALAHLVTKAVNDTGVHKGAPTLYVPADRYFLSDTFEVKGITLRLIGEAQGKDGGKGTVIVVAPNKTGIRINRQNTEGNAVTPITPTSRGADGSTIENISFQSQGGTPQGDFHGLHARARFTARNCEFSGFPGHGVLVLASSGTTGGELGNANCFLLDNVTMVSNRNCGFRASGIDANAGVITNCDASLNGRWGFSDESFLGNYFTGNHAAGNGLKGIAGNTSGSSIVSHGGTLYYVMPRQAAAAATTQPGTNPAIWAGFKPGDPGPAFPAWYSGIPVFEAGPYRTTNANARSCFSGNYAEGGQAACVFTQSTVAIGNFLDEAGTIGYDSPVCVLTSRFGALENPGGFHSKRGAQTLTSNANGYLTEFRHDDVAPNGFVAQFSSTDLRYSYSGSDANEYMRVLGPNTHNPMGKYALMTHRLALGLGFSARRLNISEGPPNEGFNMSGNRVLNNTPVVGGPEMWTCTYNGTPGVWTPSGIVGGVQAAAVPDLAAAATLGDVVAKVNAILASERSARLRAA